MVEALNARKRWVDLLRLVEEQGEEATLCCDNRPVAKMRGMPPAPDHLEEYNHLQSATFLPGWDEPLFSVGFPEAEVVSEGVR